MSVRVMAQPPLWRRVLPALAVYIAVRLLGVVALAGWAAATGRPGKAPHTLLTRRWDSLWYSRIAQDGYGYSVHTPSGDLHSDLAFFPLMPLLERAGHALTNLPASDIGLFVSVVASCIAAVGIYAVTECCIETCSLTRRGAAHQGKAVDARPLRASGLAQPSDQLLLSAPFIAVVVWAIYPVGVVQWMAYSESLFTALAAWALYAVMTRRWICAGVLASLAGLTRPVGLGVILAVWVGVVLALGAQRRSASPEGGRPSGPAWRPLLGAVVAPLGLGLYVVWVARRTGQGLEGYVDVQAGWRNGFDGGLTFSRFIVEKFFAGDTVLVGVGLLGGVALALWAVVACFRMRLPWPVLTYVVVLAALAVGAKGYFGSKPRFFVPIFPLLFPLAVWLSTRCRPRVLFALGVFAAGSAVFGAVWLNGSGPP